MCSNVVEEVMTCMSHCSCAVALVYCNGTECGKKCWVNCLFIVQEGTHDVLDAFDLLWGEVLYDVNLHPLNPCAILDWGHLVGSMLRRDWFGVLVFVRALLMYLGIWQSKCPSV